MNFPPKKSLTPKKSKNMNKKFIITITLFLISMATYATGQEGDIIYIDGTQWTLLGKPISRDTTLWGQVRAAIPQQHVITSSNWSGFTAFWSIRQDVLYLDSIQYMRPARDNKTLPECIPGRSPPPCPRHVRCGPRRNPPSCTSPRPPG